VSHSPCGDAASPLLWAVRASGPHLWQGEDLPRIQKLAGTARCAVRAGKASTIPPGLRAGTPQRGVPTIAGQFLHVSWPQRLSPLASIPAIRRIRASRAPRVWARPQEGGGFCAAKTSAAFSGATGCFRPLNADGLSQRDHRHLSKGKFSRAGLESAVNFDA
jgi:hypothetical protein